MRQLLMTAIAVVMIVGCGGMSDEELYANRKLLVAIENNEIGKFKEALAEGADVNLPPDTIHNNKHFLAQAALKGNLKMVEMLIAEGAEVDGNDAFTFASVWNHWKIALLLIENGVDSDQISEGMLHAARMGSMETIEVLVKKGGADVNATGIRSKGKTPLHYAVEENKMLTVKLLIDFGANVNAKSEAGLTPLDYSDNSRISAILRKHGGEEGE